MPYRIGSKGSNGCSGYPAVKESTGEVMGCHTTRAQAAAQIYAINRSEGNIGKAMVKEGDMVMTSAEDEIYVGRIVHVMTDGLLGFEGSEYAISASQDEPAVLVQLFEMEEGELEETSHFIGAKASEVMPMPTIENNMAMDKVYEGCGCPTCKELNVNCENCPVCQANAMKNSCCGDMAKVKDKPNYDTMIKPRSGGSDPANPKLYARVVQAAKDKFDVYPSAVANGWVVQEYKRRGGTYKASGIENELEKGNSLWNNTFNPRLFNK